MTGWRIGYCAGPPELIAGMNKVQSQISSGACSIAQAAAAQALTGPQDCVTEFREAFERRRNLVVDAIKKIDGLSLEAPRGAFYAFVGCDDYIGTKTPAGDTISNDVEFAQFILEDANVATVPGSAYGLSPYFRLSTATSDDILATAMTRIAESTTKLIR